MAIVIPSKHIYSKDNDKVRDNIIDRIEVSAKEVVPNNEYDTSVYNQSYYEGFNYENFIIDEKKDDDTYNYGWALYSYYKLMPIYLLNITIKVPKLQKNRFIEKIFYSYKEENNKKIPDIKTSIYSKKYIGTITTTVTNYISGNNFDIIYSTPIYNSTPTIGINELSPSLKYEFERSGGGYPIISEINFNNKENIINPQFIEDKQYYNLTFTVFSGYEEIKGGGYNEYSKGSLVWTEQKSECVKIIPEKIEITIYGNTIGIDLNDKTVYIHDESGNKPFSVEGNELMQIENYIDYSSGDKFSLQLIQGLGAAGYGYAILANPSIDINTGENIYYNGESALVSEYGQQGNQIVIIVEEGGEFYNKIGGSIECYLNSPPQIKNQIEENFSKTLKDYSQGKETATILCDISDYYDTEGNKVIFKSGISQASISFTWDEFISVDISLGYAQSYITLTKGNIKQGDIIKTINGYIEFETDANIGDKCWCKIYGTIEYAKNIFKIGSATIERVGEMTFSLYNKVIPMVYGANGVDKPLSKYKDGTPKKFKVLGTRIFYDGAVWQELTLQETL